MSAAAVKPLQADLQRARVLVVGDAMLDRYLFGDVERISPEAPVPVVRVTREEDRLGGAANVALNVRALGPVVTLITVVGDDEPARKLEALLTQRSIESLLGRDPQLYTSVKLRVIGRAQQLVRVDFENQPDHEILSGMLANFEHTVPSCGAVIFSDYGKGGLTHIAEMIERSRAAGKPVLVDPKGADYSRYAGATVVTPNRAELAQVIGPWSSEQQLEERVANLRRTHRIGALLLTRSEEGMSLFDADGHVRIGAQAREVFDVTGAGDTVIATMAAMLAAGLSLREAMPIANRAGGIVVGKFGTATASFEEVFA
jgi:rfaE bifunctional protein kinase chain/domain